MGEAECKTYATPAHAKAFVERHWPFLHQYSLDTVHDAVDLSVLIRHQPYLDDVWWDKIDVSHRYIRMHQGR